MLATFADICVVFNLILMAWLFAGTFEPLRSWKYKQPVSRQMIVSLRIIAGIAIVLSLTALGLRLLHLSHSSGTIHIIEGR